MRINKFVASATGLSRRASDAAIAEGQVSINGRVAILGDNTSEGDDIRLEGKPLNIWPGHTLIMLNKPAGYVSSRARQGASPTLYDLLDPKHYSLRIVGRLDRQSSGLVLLTDDGIFIQRHTHPSFGKIKNYEVQLNRPLSPADRTRVEAGVELGDGLSRLKVERVTGRAVSVSLSEGRNRQIRRTFGALGYTVDKLHRTSMGAFAIGDLPSGEWKKLDMENQS